MFIDAQVVYGTSTIFSGGINQLDSAGQNFEPMDLSPYSIRFRVLGSATADAQVLVEHIINDYSNVETDGAFVDAINGQFEFTITADDTKTLGLGAHPISIELLDYGTDNVIYNLTQGGKNGEFNRIYVVQV